MTLTSVLAAWAAEGSASVRTAAAPTSTRDRRWDMRGSVVGALLRSARKLLGDPAVGPEDRDPRLALAQQLDALDRAGAQREAQPLGALAGHAQRDHLRGE